MTSCCIQMNRTFFLCVLLFSLAAESFAASPPIVTNLGTLTTGVRTPVRLAIDSSGNFFVTDPRGGGVLRFNSAGTFLGIFATTAPASGIAVTAGNTLFVSEGSKLASINSSGVETILPPTFTNANGVAVDLNSVYVVDSVDKSVRKFSTLSPYTEETNFASNVSSTLPSNLQFIRPTGITFNSKNTGQEIAVVDSLAGRIHFFTTTGIYVKTVGVSGSGPGKFTSPQSISLEFDSANTLVRMYVLDSYQSVIHVLDSTGTPIPVTSSSPYIGGYGKTKGKLVNPSDMIFDTTSRRLLVANSLGNLTMYGINGGSNPVFTVDNGNQTIGSNSAPAPISGTAVAGTRITVNGTPVSVAVNGSWATTISGLTQGPNRVTIVATDVDGNTTTKFVSVDYEPAAAGPLRFAISAPSNNSTLDSPTQNITGFAGSGINTIRVTVNGTPQEVPVLNGTFSTPIVLDRAINSVLVTDGSGTATLNLTFAPSANSTPPLQITYPANGTVVNDLNALNGSITASGTSQANTAISVSLNGANQTVTSNSSGAWTAPLTLRVGLNTIEAVSGGVAYKASVAYNPDLAMAITSPPSDVSTNSSTYRVTGTTSSFSILATLYSPNGNASEIPVTVANNAFTINPVFTADGIYRLAITCIDSYGNAVTTYRNFNYISILTSSAASFLVTSGTTGAPAISGTSRPGDIVSLRDATGADVRPPVLAAPTTGYWEILGIGGSGFVPSTMFVTAVDAANNSSRTGHINGSGTGSVDITDAITAIRISLGVTTATASNLLYGDVAPLINGVSRPDGRISLDDLLLIMRRVVGLSWY